MIGARTRYRVALEYERGRLLGVLSRRAVRLHLREALRATHKDPLMPSEVWEEALRVYVLMFPRPDESEL